MDSDGKFNVEDVVEAGAEGGALHGSGRVAGLVDTAAGVQAVVPAVPPATAPHCRHQTPPSPARHTSLHWRYADTCGGHRYADMTNIPKQQ